MEKHKYALVTDNVVTNIVLWSGNVDEWQPPVGSIAIKSDLAYIGDWWEEAEGIFYRPIVPAPVTEETDEVSEEN